MLSSKEQYDAGGHQMVVDVTSNRIAPFARPPLSVTGQQISDDIRQKLKDKEDATRWFRQATQDAYAAELVNLHACSLALEQEYGSNPEKDVGVSVSSGEHVVTHLGQGVFVQNNTHGIDSDSKSHPKTITTVAMRDFARLCLHTVDNSDRNFVLGTGQPGIGKTRGAMAQTLQSLLWRGEVVVRLDYKENNAYLFLPDEKGDYQVWWCSPKSWEYSSFPQFHDTIYVLTDPPEKGTYKAKFSCRCILYASNNEDKHDLRDAEKFGRIFVMKIPTLDEILCMESVLWSTLTPIGKQNFETTELRLEELCNRCAVVGCIVRDVYIGVSFCLAYAAIDKSASQECSESGIGKLLDLYKGLISGGSRSAVAAKSRFFLTEPVFPSLPEVCATDHLKVKTSLLPFTAYVVREKLLEKIAGLEGAQAFQYEDVCAMLLKGGWWNGKELPQRRVVCGANLKHTTSLILKSAGAYVVRASNCYPILDFATSSRDWYNAKVGESVVKISLSAFVTLMISLGFGEVVDGNFNVKASLGKITLTMIRNSSVRTHNYDTSLAKKYEDLGLTPDKVRVVFEKVVDVVFFDTATWSPEPPEEEETSTAANTGKRKYEEVFKVRMATIKQLLDVYQPIVV